MRAMLDTLVYFSVSVIRGKLVLCCFRPIVVVVVVTGSLSLISQLSSDMENAHMSHFRGD